MNKFFDWNLSKDIFQPRLRSARRLKSEMKKSYMVGFISGNLMQLISHFYMLEHTHVPPGRPCFNKYFCLSYNPTCANVKVFINLKTIGSTFSLKLDSSLETNDNGSTLCNYSGQATEKFLVPQKITKNTIEVC